jgi:alpha-D-xyloside xylohydrolase
MDKIPHQAPSGFDWVTGIESWEVVDDALKIVCRTAYDHRAHLLVEVLTPHIWHILFRPLDSQPFATPIVVGRPERKIPLQVESADGQLVVSGGGLRLSIQTDSWRLRLYDANGADVLRENPSDVDGLGQPFVLPLGYAATADGVNLVSESFHLRPDEHLLGLGEKFTPLDKVGQRIVTWTQDAFGSTSERSHKNIPFLMSSRGYGLLLDTGARVTWDLGVSSCQSYTITAEANALDAYVIVAPSFAEILEHYAHLTGHAPVPPKWTFGLWLSSTGAYRDQATLERLVAGAEAHQLPVDVIHVDTWWMKWRLYCDFQWDREAYPDVEGLIAELTRKGLRVSLWEHPYISVESDLFELGKERGYFLKRPDGDVYVIDYGLSLAPRPDGVVRIATPDTSWNARVAIIDLTNPQAYQWFQDLHRPVLRMGVSVFKTDFGEDVPRDAVFSNGQTGETMHNLYPLLYNRCVYEVTQEELGYGVVWARSGTAGNQRYPVCWSGDPAADFDSLACTIRAGLSVGLSGIPFWSHDIGAFRGMPSARLYVRWAQFGLLCSHSRMHGDSPREPWYFGEEAVRIVRAYTELRYSLFPYLYSAAYEASRSGLPVIRALPLMFPDDPNTYAQDLEYMLGGALLVAPIYDEGDQRRVYLPQGEWVDYWTHEVYAGNVHITVHAPLDHLPLFVRRGAIIPRMQPAQRIPAGLIDPLLLDVYAASRMAYRLDEDEGTTIFEGTIQDGVLHLDWRGDPVRKFLLRVIGVQAVTAVALQVGGEVVPIQWTVGADGVLQVETPAVAAARLNVTYR